MSVAASSIIGTISNLLLLADEILPLPLPLPPMVAGDLIAFRSAGAYGAVMASEYNSRPLVPEVLVNGDQWAVIRPRPSVEEMLARDRLPEWLAG